MKLLSQFSTYKSFFFYLLRPFFLGFITVLTKPLDGLGSLLDDLLEDLLLTFSFLVEFVYFELWCWVVSIWWQLYLEIIEIALLQFFEIIGIAHSCWFPYFTTEFYLFLPTRLSIVVFKLKRSIQKKHGELHWMNAISFPFSGYPNKEFQVHSNRLLYYFGCEVMPCWCFAFSIIVPETV